jgi:hypothetical protein
MIVELYAMVMFPYIFNALNIICYGQINKTKKNMTTDKKFSFTRIIKRFFNIKTIYICNVELCIIDNILYDTFYGALDG